MAVGWVLPNRQGEQGLADLEVFRLSPRQAAIEEFRRGSRRREGNDRPPCPDAQSLV